MTRFEEVRGRLVARADEHCPTCHPKTPRTDVSPPSRRSAVKPPWAGVSPPSRPSTDGFAYDTSDVRPHRPDRGDRAIDAARVVVGLMLLVPVALLAGLLIRHVWLAVS